MEGPRPPIESEFDRVLEFLDDRLRPNSPWSIATEYPTALSRANLNNIRIITEAEKVVSHAVLKPLIIKTPLAIFKVGAIGSVVTDEAHRNQGFSRQILDNCVEEARNQDCDVAMLWTNLYDFYRKLGFELAGSEVSCVFEKEFTVEDTKLRFVKGSQVSPEAIYRLYSQHTVGSVRSTEDIRKFLSIPQTQLYTAWDQQNQLVAYAVEGKGVDLTGYIHEWGGKVTAIAALMAHIRKEKKAPFTIIMPEHSQNLIQYLQKFSTTTNHGYLGMIKIINFEGLFSKVKRAARAKGIADMVLEKREGEFIFGFGKELIPFTDERLMTQLIFGPVPEIDTFSPATRQMVEKIFPLPLWIWGWDSV